jgi:two-component system sensor histidine kinase UhpB
MEEHGGSERLAVALDALDRGLEETRRLGRDLNSELWQHRSLEEAIRSEVERIVRVARVQVQLHRSDDLPVPDADTKVMLFRLFQVILTNALRHSAADRITVELRNEGGLALTIGDNGRGFDPYQVNAHAGLKNIETRCALIGYTARCTTAPGAGCTWHLKRSLSA